VDVRREKNDLGLCLGLSPGLCGLRLAIGVRLVVGLQLGLGLGLQFGL